MVKRKRTALEKQTNLPSLQNQIRRDPPSYRDDFLIQFRHYESQRDIFLAQPEGYDSEPFIEQLGFITHVADCYPDVTKRFPQDLADLLLHHHNTLEPDLREKLVQCLVQLRNKDVIPSTALLQTLFPILTTTNSKHLRSQLYHSIVSDIRNANAKTKNHRLNKTVQGVLFSVVEAGKGSPDAIVGLWAVKVTRELWRRNIWDDARTVEIIKEASLSANAKVMSGGVRFFLGVDKEREEMDESSDDEDYNESLSKLKHQAGVSGKTKKKQSQMERAVDKLKKKERNKHKASPLNFSALHLLHDPQGFAENLYSMHLAKSNNKLSMEQRLLVLQLVSRLIGLHKLTVIGIYSYLLKYLTPRQREVTRFLVAAAQATHDQVPPDLLEPIIRKIADEFVSEGVAGEVATAGLNSIREICARQPLAMDESLLQDLTTYKGSKDKGVVMAARSLIGLYREVAPDMLKRKDRGKTATMEMKNKEKLRFGEEPTGTIEGLDLLEKWYEEQKQKKIEEGGEEAADEEEEDQGWEGWDVESDSDDSGSWIGVSDDEKDIEISDSEDEKPSAKAKKTKPQENKEDGMEIDAEDQGGSALSTNSPSNFLSLATTRILTPADLATIAKMRAAADLQKASSKTITALRNEDEVDESLIEGPKTRGKSDKEARLAAVQEGREGREKYSSKRGKTLAEKPHSTTNKEKARKKNFLMTLGQAKKKQKRSLIEHRRILKAHVEKQKKGK
ncbi:Severe Depolymerization of Actin [Orbilia oligospora]|uniref:Protein SDA1 n=1 Tax=Orbilia oligospora TaxID=2813651 RepID=A0A7C8P7A7_ORBOL|nr:Severe Depolymerization of Actin [Orbilia oligospora]KAF3185184.1 Severe Depolymerization of Actin [Orbilia oligospora]KAF3234144.1 Severe Depolymerization of Actin [Orbilia oligospora]KAF3253842.1 Severe Depolymerization of Actin [Orbilia oligospora]KAF3293973.1 Severe Depolymerization of Actin [Orbilia oligospora]